MTAKDGGNSSGKTKLSKNLLQMKFMKRTALKEEEQEQKEQKKVVEDAEHWRVPDLGHKERAVLIEHGYTSFEDLRFGRMSFKGFNPNLEKIMLRQNNEMAEAEIDRKEEQNTIQDDEMAERYNSLIHTMHKKFEKKKGGKHEGEMKKGGDMEGEGKKGKGRKTEGEGKKGKGGNRKRSKKGDNSPEDDAQTDPSPPKKKREFKKPSD